MPEVAPDSVLPWLLAHAVPLSFATGAVVAGRGGNQPATAWRLARMIAVVALGFAGAAFGSGVAAGIGWRAAWLSVLLLVAFLGWVLTRFCGTYLAGESRQQHFVRWLLGTLAGSSLVVATDHLAVLVLAWIGASLSLQNLLTFYGDRPAAQMAAHKKFLVSRGADTCMVVAAVLLWSRFDTLHIDSLAGLVGAGDAGEAQAAIVLVAIAAVLKSAQLPFHGWLMQVMEAPTPVSALLHAGVVNLGGFVLIRLHPLLDVVPVARVLLVLFGSVTALLAALVATTRVSIKVALAWSTCAQMGFMVLQCGLGLYEMALLHLLAHSLYKAHAFLGAGTTVQVAMVRAMAKPVPAPGTFERLFAALLAAGMVWLASRTLGVGVGDRPALLAMAFVVVLALTPLLTGNLPRAPWLRQVQRLAVPLAVAAIYFGLHRLLHGLLPGLLPGSLPEGLPSAAGAAPVDTLLAAWVVVCFSILFVVQTLAAVRPSGRAARWLRTWCYGGLFLDEWFTRLTLRVWPIRRPPLSAASDLVAHSSLRR